MIREQLEKMFDEKFCHKIDKWFIDYDWTSSYTELKNWIDEKKLKQFIFETIIPEVLKSVMDDEVKNICSKEINPILHWCDLWWNEILQNIKQKAKELYNITL